MKDFGRIGVLMGGYSSEREISLKSGKAIYEALFSQGCDVVAVDIIQDRQEDILEQILKSKMDVAFIALHGKLGEDGRIQSLLEKVGIPYTGSGVEANRLAINKVAAQTFFKENGLRVPSYQALSRKDVRDIDGFIEKFNSYPVVVKPSCEGSSIGVNLVKTSQELKDALTSAWQYGDEILLEEYIKGKEITVGILDSQPLVCIEICYKRSFFDFAAKYSVGHTEYILPARISSDVANRLQARALKAHNLLGCRNFSRVDFMLDADEREYILEVNTIPGFTATSLLPKAAAHQGINFSQLCLKLLELIYVEKKEDSGSSCCCEGC